MCPAEHTHPCCACSWGCHRNPWLEMKTKDAPFPPSLCFWVWSDGSSLHLHISMFLLPLFRPNEKRWNPSCNYILKCFSWKRGDNPKSTLRKSTSPPKAAKILSAHCKKEADFLSQPLPLCLPPQRWASVAVEKGILSLCGCLSLTARSESKVWHFPSSFCCDLQRSVCLKLMRWNAGVSQMEFLSPSVAHRFVLAPGHTEWEFSLQISVRVRWQLHVTEFTANTRLEGDRTQCQAGSSQQTRLLFRETSALRASKWAPKTSLGKPPPALGSPGMQLVTPERVTPERTLPWSGGWGTWCGRTELGFGSSERRKLQHQALHRGAQHQDRMWWGQVTVGEMPKTSSKPLLSPSLGKAPSELPQQPACIMQMEIKWLPHRKPQEKSDLPPRSAVCPSGLHCHWCSRIHRQVEVFQVFFHTL